MPDDYYVSQYSGEEIDDLLGKVGSATGAVRYDAAQTLTDSQKQQARTNIGAVKSTFLGNISRNQIYKIGYFFEGTGSSNRGAVTLRVCDVSSYGNENYMLAFLGGAGCAAEYRGVFEPDLVSKIFVYSDPSATGAAKKYIIFAMAPNYGDWVAVYTDHEHSFTRDFVDVTDTFSTLVNGLNKVWESVYEYANPPMQLGVEYRTTERFFGKPVYVQLVNFGANTSGANLYVGENVDKIVRHAEYFLGRNPAPAYNGEPWPNTMTCVFQAEVATNPSTSKGAAKLFCYTGSGYSGGDTAVIARVAYTKSTD